MNEAMTITTLTNHCDNHLVADITCIRCDSATIRWQLAWLKSSVAHLRKIECKFSLGVALDRNTQLRWNAGMDLVVQSIGEDFHRFFSKVEGLETRLAIVETLVAKLAEPKPVPIVGPALSSTKPEPPTDWTVFMNEKSG